MPERILPFYFIIFTLAVIITVISERRLIPILTTKARQPIYEEGPSWHSKKYGTPTMGGIGFIIAFVICSCISYAYLSFSSESYYANSLLINSLFCIANAAIGFIDDFAKLKRKENEGLSPRQKIILQAVIAVLYIVSRSLLLSEGTELYFLFGSYDIGILYYPLSFFAILGTVNCANLTDGIDGLASGVAFAIGLSLFYVSATTVPDVSLLSVAVIGLSLGFLLFNINPAKIFMGDTGSLFFGSFAICSAFSLGNPLLVMVHGIIYLLEGISVIIQVICYKIFKKRIFKMAPLHHHFEKCGWSENKILLCALFITLVFGIIGFTIFF